MTCWLISCTSLTILSSDLPGLINQRNAGFDLLTRLGDQLLDLLGGSCGTLCQFPDLLGDNRKTLACVAGPRRLDTGIQSQKIGLERNVVNDTDNIGDLLRRRLDLAHRGDGLLHHAAGMLRAGLGLADQITGFFGALPPSTSRSR